MRKWCGPEIRTKLHWLPGVRATSMDAREDSLTRIWQKIKNLAVIRDAAIVASGTIVAQAINLVGYALSTRLLSPAEFGIFAAHIALALPIALLATGRYEVAFIRANSDGSVINLLALTSAITVIVSFIAAGCVAIAKGYVPYLSQISLLTFVLLIVGRALQNSTTQLGNFTRQYGLIGNSRMIGAFAGQTLMLILASSGVGAQSLVIGFAFGTFVSVLLLFLGHQAWFIHSSRYFSLRRSRRLGQRYFGLVLFNTPQALMGAFQDSATIVLVTYYFGPSGAGLYALNGRCLSAPTAVVAESLGRVFQRYIADLSKPSREIETPLEVRRRKLLQIFEGVIGLGLITGITLWLFAPTIVPILFGNEWSELINLIRSATPYYAMHLVAATLVTLPIAAGANFRLLAIIGTIGSVMYVLLFFLGGLFFTNISSTFLFVSMCIMPYFILMITYSYFITRRAIQ